MIRKGALFAMMAIPAAAQAVGLGPLHLRGVTDGPGKAFYLTLSNPYDHVERFEVAALDKNVEIPSNRVTLFPSNATLASHAQRRVIVIVRGLEPGETFEFRVCAQRPPKPEESINARVCSSLSARRLTRRAA